MDDSLTPKERADEMRLLFIKSKWETVLVFGLIAALLIGALCSCSTQQKIVPVPEIHENHHWHTDSIPPDGQHHPRNADDHHAARFGSDGPLRHPAKEC